MSVRYGQENARSPMVVTEEGMLMLVKPMQPQNLQLVVFQLILH